MYASRFSFLAFLFGGLALLLFAAGVARAAVRALQTRDPQPGLGRTASRPQPSGGLRNIRLGRPHLGAAPGGVRYSSCSGTHPQGGPSGETRDPAFRGLVTRSILSGNYLLRTGVNGAIKQTTQPGEIP